MKRRIFPITAMLLVSALWSIADWALSKNTAHAQVTYNLLIIAPDGFIDELQPLKRFKDASGRPAILLSLTHVYQQFAGVDDAEKIKRCIAYHAQHSGVKHVMLAGDVDKLPVRWRWWGRWMPDDPYFTGDWAVVGGKYRQSDSQTQNRPFGAWVDIGSWDRYTIEVDVTRLAGEQARVLFADAERHDGAYRLEILANGFRVRACEVENETSYTFALNQSYRVRVELAPTSILVYVDGVQVADIPLDTSSLVYPGKVGVGTYQGAAEFDNFEVRTTSGTVLWDEDFDDGTADGFIDGLTMSERGWAVSELYYADLFKNGTYEFDNWDGNGNGLYGEIEFKLPGYCPTCTINYDHIDYLPDVSVGRLAASTDEEVKRYVDNVIAYELSTRPSDTWFKRASLYEGDIGGGYQNDQIEAYLQGLGFAVSNRHWAGDLENQTPQQRKDIVINDLESGVGFANYLGHGQYDAWSTMNFNSSDISSLTNEGMLPIAVAGACLTGRFAPAIPPQDAYTDQADIEHPGVSQCEPFPGTDAAPKTLQVDHDMGCIGEDFQFNAGSAPQLAGAIAYLGEARVGRSGGFQLSEYFFKAYSEGIAVGDMWKEMIGDYYWANHLDQSHTWDYGPEMWNEGHKFDEPQKFVLFGDPSLIVGGAYDDARSGSVWDSNGGPWLGTRRYRVEGGVSVPTGLKLTVFPGASVLFEDGSRLTAWGTGPDEGLILDATAGMPVYFLSLGPDPQSEHVVQGIKVAGQVRVRNGGQIRLH